MSRGREGCKRAECIDDRFSGSERIQVAQVKNSPAQRPVIWLKSSPYQRLAQILIRVLSCGNHNLVKLEIIECFRVESANNVIGLVYTHFEPKINRVPATNRDRPHAFCWHSPHPFGETGKVQQALSVRGQPVQ